MMEILHGLDGLRQLPPGSILSIGNFDGVHLGHAAILERARQLRGQSTSAKIAVGTFEPHPLTVLRPELAPPRLTPGNLKQRFLADAGVDFLVLLPPEKAVLDLSAEDFWAALRDQVRPSHLVEGSSFNFGRARGGSIELLRQWSHGTAVRVHTVPGVEAVLLDLSVVAVSSSLIRWLLIHGRVRDAAICLGRPYLLSGPVVKGHQRGRTIGIPTANLDCSEQLIPLDGVYAGRCRIVGRAWPAAVSIGAMPTFGENSRQVEAHLIGFSGDLYGQSIDVELLDWVREQRKYNSVDALVRQMKTDLAYAVERANIDASRPLAELGL